MQAKIILEKNETPEEAEEFLLKALGAQHRGDTHSHAFPDPGIDHVSESMKRKHAEMMERLLKEISEILELP